MKALIAFIVMAVAVLTLIEINERIKAKRARNTGAPTSPNPKDCEKEQSGQEDCSDCGLIEVCDKKQKTVG